ncbi:uncharacterized protein LOC122056063 [Zingiber officinale]|uniref:Uncharacterized protein n=1 Tax=Zingiber officinale TaxID=94328 RepID=A0A8J5H1E7_ZINOF|nr:uncharacterized protein LOC122056063 [Zingiber officinale]KAG6517719.1 hypothetical protein ZIOFF_021117 [Zingiber officinale]
MQSTGYLQDAVAQWIHPLINATPPPPLSLLSPPSIQELHHLLQGDSDSRCSSLEEPRQLKSSSRRVLVMCPFAVVKPDDVTLEDINARFLRRPQRSVRHSATATGVHKRRQGMPGLSGKAVVAATRIRTGGRGTITIIKTK